jgi:ubiquinone/menaquinone biosynthesis C-methylase UbiE
MQIDKMNEYYSKRAQEYEQIYHRDDPVRQSEQNKIADVIKNAFRNRNVLEIACGTGFWTTFLSDVAKSIVAIDNSDEVLKIARSKHYKSPTYFQKCDAYNLPFHECSYDGGLANFWFSHIPKEKIELFLRGFHRVLSNRARVFMADNVFNEGIGGKLVQETGNSNTYKIRTLEGGEQYKVLKNYYSKEQIVSTFCKEGEIIEIYYGKCFWYILYKLNKKWCDVI